MVRKSLISRSSPGRRRAGAQQAVPVVSQPTTKAVAHPLRSHILKALKEGDKPTVELENITGRPLQSLPSSQRPRAGRARRWTMRDNKTKLYHLQTPETPR